MRQTARLFTRRGVVWKRVLKLTAVACVLVILTSLHLTSLHLEAGPGPLPQAHDVLRGLVVSDQGAGAVPVGETLTLTVRAFGLAAGGGLKLLQLGPKGSLRFDPQILEILKVESSAFTLFDLMINNESGVLRLRAGRIDRTEGLAVGEIFWIKMKCKAEGSSSVGFDEAEGFDALRAKDDREFQLSPEEIFNTAVVCRSFPEEMPPQPKVIPFDWMPDGALVAQRLAEGRRIRGGFLNWAHIRSPKTLNPIIASIPIDDASQPLVAQLNAPLLEKGPGELIEGALVQSASVSADGKTVTLSLREGLRWSDGTPFTTDDVLFTFKEVLFNSVFIEKGLSNAPEFFAVEEELPLVTSPSSNTVELYWEKGVPRDVFEFLTYQAFAPLPAHRLSREVLTGRADASDEEYAEAFRAAWSADAQPCGAPARPTDPRDCLTGLGPFVLAAPVLPDLGAKLVRNPFFWKVDGRGNPLPYLDGQNVFFVRDANVTAKLFIAGQTDILTLWLPSSQTIEEIQQLGEKVRVALGWPSGLGSGQFITFQQDRRPDEKNIHLRAVFRNPEFRRAISNLLDREQVVKQVFHCTSVPWFQPGVASKFLLDAAIDAEFAHLIEELKFDPARASGRLDTLGLKDTNGDGVRDVPVDWGFILPGPNGLLDSQPLGDDFVQEILPELERADVLIQPGPNGLLETPVAGDDVAIRTEEVGGLEFKLITDFTCGAEISKLLAEQAQTAGLKIIPQPTDFVTRTGSLFEGDWDSITTGLSGDWRGGGVLDSCGNLHFWKFSDCQALQGKIPDDREPYQKRLDELAALFEQGLSPSREALLSREWQLLVAAHLPMVFTARAAPLGAVRIDRLLNAGDLPLNVGPVKGEVTVRLDLR